VSSSLGGVSSSGGSIKKEKGTLKQGSTLHLHRSPQEG
jgi:hypothetical protein